MMTNYLEKNDKEFQDKISIDISTRFLNPLWQIRSKYNQILISDGFHEVKNSCFAENFFWDAFFIWNEYIPDCLKFNLVHPKRSKSIKSLYPDYYASMKENHESINTTKDWSYEFTEEKTTSNFMRGDTTPMLHRFIYEYSREYELNGKKFEPKKLFGIDRCFRDDIIDKTHLTEFHTIEGYIIDYDLSLGHILGNVAHILDCIGITKYRFVPAFVADCGPGCEILAYHQKMNKWIEIGGCGFRRPELTLPLNLPEGVNICGFGISLERTAMIHLNVDDIRKISKSEFLN